MIPNNDNDLGMDWPSSYLGNYRLIRLLGRGGFASVYLGEHQYLKRLAAIKLLRTVLDEPEKARFLIEAKLLAGLSHPHIVRVLEFAIARRRTITQSSVTIENIPFLVMDYVASGSLRTIYPAGTCLSLKTINTYVKQTADALQYAHDRHLIHRDIKPENLLLNEQQDVMLSDFGLALFSPRPGLLSKQEMAGTLPYTAPEQLRGKPVFASDQYSLAIVAYEWLCGHVPFQGQDVEIMLAHSFSVPPSLRSQNASIPQEVEDVIMKALSKDAEQRYATVQAFAQAFENACEKKRPVLVKQLQTSKFMPTKQHPKTLPFYYYLSRKSVDRPQESDVSRHRHTLKKRKTVLISLLSLLLLFSLVIFAAKPLLTTVASVIGSSMPGITAPSSIGVTKAPDGELIGVSDGSYTFDTSRPDATVKEQAAQKLRDGDIGSAFSLLSTAHTMDTSDAEVLIYQENLRAINSKYITIVVGTTLTGDTASIAVGRENLQGAYIAQREYNDTSDQHNGVKVRLLIANSGSQTAYVSPIVQQIIRLAQSDKTIVGVMGWTVSANAFAAVTPLTQAHIPMVSTAAADNLTGISNYFFRTAAPANMQSIVAAQYAQQTLQAKSAALFLDPTNDYSRSLAEDFKNSFVANGNTIVATETYTVGDATNNSQRLVTELQDALRHHPNVIYFGGYPADVSVLLQHMQPSDPPVMGGNSFYQLGAYPPLSPSSFSHLHFTALAYPDEWNILGLTTLQPAFFTDYPAAFGPVKPGSSPYGYIRADSGTTLAHDATLALLQASSNLLQDNSPLTGSNVQQALSELNGVNTLQGVTGQIAFGDNGDPINKAIAVVCSKGGAFKLDTVEGQFLQNGPVLNTYPVTSNCA